MVQQASIDDSFIKVTQHRPGPVPPAALKLANTQHFLRPKPEPAGRQDARIQ